MMKTELAQLGKIGSKYFLLIWALLPLISHVPHAVSLTGVEDFEAQYLTGVPYLSQPRPPFGWEIREKDLLYPDS